MAKKGVPKVAKNDPFLTVFWPWKSAPWGVIAKLTCVFLRFYTESSFSLNYHYFRVFTVFWSFLEHILVIFDQILAIFDQILAILTHFWWVMANFIRVLLIIARNPHITQTHVVTQQERVISDQ